MKKIANFFEKNHLILAALLSLSWSIVGIIHMIPPTNVMYQNGHPLSSNASYNNWSFKHYNYSDLLALWIEHKLYLHSIPYISNRIEYPPIIGLYMWGASFFPGYTGYFISSALGIGLSLFLSFVILFKIIGHKAWLLLLCPFLYSYELLNWDYLGIVFLVAGIYYARKQNYFKAGIFFSLGTFTKLFPVFYAFYYFLSLTFQSKKKQRLDLIKGFIIPAVLTNIVFMLGNFINWVYFYAYNISRSGTSSFLDMFFPLAHIPLPLIEISSIFIIVVALFISGKILKANPSLVLEVSAFFLAAFFFSNKVFSPQYIAWLYVALLVVRIPSIFLIAIGIGGLIDFICVCLTISYWDSGIPQIISYEERYLVMAIAMILLLKTTNSLKIKPLKEFFKRETV